MKALEIVNGRVPGYRIHLDDLNYAVEPGDHVLVDGPPGSGKSKFLRMISGLLEPSEGWVYHNEKPFTYALDDAYFADRRDICYFLRGLEPFADYSVYENIELFFRMCTTKTDAEVQDIVLERLFLIGMRDKSDRYPDFLTIEERQLLGLAMNCKDGGSVYIIDGVLAGLKPENQKIALKLLGGIDFSRATLLVNMQDNQVLGLEGTRILRLENGHIAYDGKVVGTPGMV